jgi:hypothetical protein
MLSNTIIITVNFTNPISRTGILFSYWDAIILINSLTCLLAWCRSMHGATVGKVGNRILRTTLITCAPHAPFWSPLIFDWETKSDSGVQVSNYIIWNRTAIGGGLVLVVWILGSGSCFGCVPRWGEWYCTFSVSKETTKGKKVIIQNYYCTFFEWLFSRAALGTAKGISTTCCCVAYDAPLW